MQTERAAPERKAGDYDVRAGRQKLLAGVGIYAGLLLVLWFVAQFFRVEALKEYPFSTLLAFATLFAPYWLFGFGLAAELRRMLSGTGSRVTLASSVAIPYFILELPRGTFHWQVAVVLVAIPVLVAAALEAWPRPANWADLLVLSSLGLAIDLGLLSHGKFFGVPDVNLWPAGLGGFPKMMMADVALYGYLVIKPIEGLGYDLIPQFDDWKIGLCEFAFYAPIVLTLGVLLGFIHWQGFTAKPQQFPAAWIFTFIFVALPEELFFRGLVQNLLERHIGRIRALGVASILFGLSHFNKTAGLPHGSGAIFNWRYVILATIAGIFYGRAWRQRKRLFASSITHTTVDTVWSIWWR